MFAVAVLGTTVTLPAHAFLNDLIGAGINLGGKLLGAGIDKVKDSMRDPEAEAKQKAEAEKQQEQAYNDKLRQIEERTDLTPLQKEQAVRALNRTVEFGARIAQMQEHADAQHRAQRDQLFTPAGLLGATAEAAVAGASTRIVLARADSLMKSGVPQAQTREVLNQVDSGVSRMPSATTLVVGAVTVAAVVDAMNEKPAQDPVTAKEAEAQAVQKAPGSVAAPAVNAFSPDLGKRIAVEFIDAPKTEQGIRERLTALGHQVSLDPQAAEVVYKIEGVFFVPESQQYTGTSQSFGRILEGESYTWTPERKIMGSIGVGVTKLFLAVGKAQGASTLPPELEQGVATAGDSIRQSVLLVIAREPKSGQATRVAFDREVKTGTTVQATVMVKATLADMLAQLGIE
jgi:hypothetical protein